jgi:hypothetical protein
MKYKPPAQSSRAIHFLQNATLLELWLIHYRRFGHPAICWRPAISTTAMGQQSSTADELLLARAEANSYKRGAHRKADEVRGRRNTSRRRRKSKIALFDATSCKSWKSSFTFPFAALVQF